MIPFARQTNDLSGCSGLPHSVFPKGPESTDIGQEVAAASVDRGRGSQADTQAPPNTSRATPISTERCSSYFEHPQDAKWELQQDGRTATKD